MIVVRYAKNKDELNDVRELIEESYRFHDFISDDIDEIAPLTLVCFDKNNLVGTAGIYKVIEIGKVTKKIHYPQPIIFAALLLGIKTYAISIGAQAWIASLKPQFIDSLCRFGIPLRILGVAVNPSRVPAKYAGYFLNSPYPPKVIICTTQDSIPAINRLSKLLNKKVKVEMGG